MPNNYSFLSAEEHRKMLDETIGYFEPRGLEKPEIGLILGSGLGGYAETIEDAVVIPYSDIPNFMLSTAPGHKGSLIFGKIDGKNVVAMQGRIHKYEGHTMQKAAYPIFTMARLGVKRLVVTNAAGGINRSFQPGDLMVISDHINLSGDNPLIGGNMDEIGSRFPDMSNLYNMDLREKLISRAKEAGIYLKEGVYAYMTGPSYETPAEIRFLGIAGADAVGMSTVPETIVANYAGMEVIAVSIISNMAAGLLNQPLTAEEVIEAANKVSVPFAKVVDIAVSI